MRPDEERSPRNTVQVLRTGTAIDDLSVFVGEMPPPEREVRQKIRTARNAASYYVTNTESPDARAMYWMMVECATAWVYRPADIQVLEMVVEYLRGLLISARRVQELEALV